MKPIQSLNAFPNILLRNKYLEERYHPTSIRLHFYTHDDVFAEFLYVIATPDEQYFLKMSGGVFVRIEAKKYYNLMELVENYEGQALCYADFRFIYYVQNLDQTSTGVF